MVGLPDAVGLFSDGDSSFTQPFRLSEQNLGKGIITQGGEYFLADTLYAFVRSVHFTRYAPSLDLPVDDRGLPEIGLDDLGMILDEFGSPLGQLDPEVQYGHPL